MKRNFHWRATLIAVFITLLAVLAWQYIANVTNAAHLTKKLEAQSLELDNKIKELEQTSKNAKELKLKTLELQKAKKALQDQLSAKRAKNRVYAAQVGISGSCSEWMEKAGVPVNSTTLTLIRKESNCNPYAMNSSSGACGIAQALPCSKMGCKWGDPICQLKWMDGYIKNRYGSWGAALNFHYANNYY
jgi:exonuclease VII small subunit